MKNTKLNPKNGKLKDLLDEMGWTYPNNHNFDTLKSFDITKGSAKTRIDWDPYSEGYTLGWSNRAIKWSNTLEKNLNEITAEAERRAERDAKDAMDKKSLWFFLGMIGIEESRISSWQTKSFRGRFKDLSDCPEEYENIGFSFMLGGSTVEPHFDFDDIYKWTPELAEFIQGLFDKLEDFKILNKL